MKKFEEVNEVMTKILKENGVEKKEINWAKQVEGWDNRYKNGYFFIGRFTDLYYPFQGEKIVLICYGKEKKFLLIKVIGGVDGTVIYNEKENSRDWSKIEDVLEKNLKNSVEIKKEQKIVEEIFGKMENLSLEKLQKIRIAIVEKINELKKEEFETKLSSYADLGYENGWSEIPEILKNKSYVIHERRKSRIEREKWVDELKVKWYVDSSD